MTRPYATANARSVHVLKGAWLWGEVQASVPQTLQGNAAVKLWEQWCAVMPDELIRMAKDVQEYAFEECLNV
jgi:hypothetical protein